MSAPVGAVKGNLIEHTRSNFRSALFFTPPTVRYTYKPSFCSIRISSPTPTGSSFLPYTTDNAVGTTQGYHYRSLAGCSDFSSKSYRYTKRHTLLSVPFLIPVTSSSFAVLGRHIRLVCLDLTLRLLLSPK